MRMIRLGSRGETVKSLQRLLKEKGYLRGEADGIFGTGTHKALAKFQKTNGLLADGVAGKRTWEELEGNRVDTWQLTEQHIVQAAGKLGVEVAAIKAVSEVESQGGGFFEEGMPKILYERHIMNRRLLAADLPLAAELGRKGRPDLVNSSWGGYRGGKHEWTRLNKAMELNIEAALESASYGRYQIMGFHWKRLGYPSVQDYVEKMSIDEGQHLDAFVRFILADSSLLAALVEKDWAKFARGYNGPSYEKHNYHGKMAEAYARQKAV